MAKQHLLMNPFPTFEVNDQNDRLLFNFACSKLSKDKSMEVEYLIKSNDLWREYYLDMKRLYDHFGENGLERPLENNRRIPLNDQSKQLRGYILKCREQISALADKLTTHDKSHEATETLRELIETGESLINIPEFELKDIRLQYINCLQEISKLLTNIISQQGAFQDDRLSNQGANFGNIQETIDYALAELNSNKLFHQSKKTFDKIVKIDENKIIDIQEKLVNQ